MIIKMRKSILVLLIVGATIAPFFIFKDAIFHSKKTHQAGDLFCPVELKECQDNVLRLLKVRQDTLAWIEAEKILSIDANDICGLWAKAEILRRSYKFQESEGILQGILSRCPAHAPSLISLAYIRHHSNRFKDALRILSTVLRQPDLDRENQALGLLLIGAVNAKRSSQGGVLGKVVYGMRIKSYFDKAKSLAPDLTEVRLGLGSFYLLAPKIAGGSVDAAIEELEYAVKLAPAFATANARLAQAYRMKGDLEKSEVYRKRAEELDPENEALREIK